jgi:formiminotetrahydrofolate cyclodeaminase
MSQTDPAFSFRNVALGAFVERLASAEPVPGGGSAAAVAASLAAALVAMVASLSEGRPKYAAHAELHVRARLVGQRLTTRFLDLADDDAAAYAGFAAAMKLPKKTEAEQAERHAATSIAARRAAEVPLLTVESCLELVATAEVLVGRSNVNASSDLDVAVLLAEAAARGAAANVLINLPSVDDESFSGEATASAMRLLSTIKEIAHTVHIGVRSGQPRDPLPA